METGNEVLKFQIYEEHNLTTGNPYAYLDIPLSELVSQEKESKLYELKGEGRGSAPKLNLTLQFVHSKVKYLESLIGKFDYYIERLNEDTTEFENDLNSLYEPFPNFYNMYQTKTFEPAKDKSFQRSFQDYTPAQQETPIKGGFVKSNLLSEDPVPFDSKVLILAGIMLFFAVFVCFARAVFFDVTTSSELDRSYWSIYLLALEGSSHKS